MVARVIVRLLVTSISAGQLQEIRYINIRGQESTNTRHECLLVMWGNETKVNFHEAFNSLSISIRRPVRGRVNGFFANVLAIMVSKGRDIHHFHMV